MAQTGEATQEIRFALSMSGGLALAVWMGGVSAELYELLRSTQGPAPDSSASETSATRVVYAKLLNLTKSSVRADVIAGTSAGGLNGAVVAFATANGAHSILGFRKLWLDAGGFDRLLRSIDVKEPPSLLKGDEYFLPEVAKALSALVANEPNGPCNPVHLVMTTTVLAGNLKRYLDSHGVEVFDIDHHGRFQFRYEPTGGGPPEKAMALRIADGGVAKEDVVARLALAARSSASFPGAFEASFIPVQRSDGEPEPPVPADRRDMAGGVNFGNDGSRYVTDGGILMNRPLQPVVEAVFKMRADSKVRRLLLLVVPDPASPERPDADKYEEPPALADVALKAILEIPKNQSLSSELDEIEKHNSAVVDLGRLRVGLGSLPDIEASASAVLPIYRELRASRSVDASIGRVLLRQDVEPGDIGVTRVKKALLERRKELLPDDLVPATPGERPWHWGLSTLRRMGSNVLAFVNSVVEQSFAEEGPAVPIPPVLSTLKTEVHSQMQNVDTIRSNDDEYWMQKWIELQSGDVGLERWAKDAYIYWPGVGDDRLAQWWGQERLLTSQLEIARALVRIGMRVRRFADDRGLDPTAEAIRTLRNFVPVPAPDSVTEPYPGEDDVLRRFLAVEVLQLMSHPDELEQSLELVELSSRCEGAIRGVVDPEEKVTSIQMGHFGGFLKRSWRANDWMWGRLDGAARYVRILLEPNRLFQLYESNRDHLLEQLLDLAGTEGADPDVSDSDREWLIAQAGADFKTALQAEIYEVMDSGEGRSRLVKAEKAILRRLELSILREELKHVARSIEVDGHRGSTPSVEARGFMFEAKEAEKNDWADPEQIVAAFRACLIGAEKVEGEIGSDYVTEVSSQSLGVALSAVQGAASKLGPVKNLMKILRGVFVGLYWMARGSIASSDGRRWVNALILMLFVVGGIVISASILSDDPSIVTSSIGLTVLATALIWTFLRAWVRKKRNETLTFLLPLLVGVAAIVLYMLDILEEGAVPIAGLAVIGATLLWKMFDQRFKPPTAVGLVLALAAGSVFWASLTGWIEPLIAVTLGIVGVFLWLAFRLVPLRVTVPAIILVTTALALLPFHIESFTSQASTSTELDVGDLSAGSDTVAESLDEFVEAVAEEQEKPEDLIRVEVIVEEQPPGWVRFIADNDTTIAAIVVTLGFVALGSTGTSVKRRLNPLFTIQSVSEAAQSTLGMVSNLGVPGGSGPGVGEEAADAEDDSQT